jgi:hypothetical protein
MNPYLEQEYVWHDFHERFIPYLAEALAPQPVVKAGYVVRIHEHIFLHERSAEERSFFGRAHASVALSSRGQAPAVIDQERLSYITVRDRRSREVVTVVELLSPMNKYAGPNREQSLAKRLVFLQSNVHLVEIDLLRGGPRMPLEGLPRCDYYVMVSRSESRPDVGLWPIRLHEPLPMVPVPLRAPDPDARLDLQALLHRVYDAAEYESDIYDTPPHPRLSPEDDAWAQAFVPHRPG